MKPFIRTGPDPEHGGLESVWVSTPHCEAQLYLFGANLIHFQPTNEVPVLFSSEAAVYDGKKAIRGGIPICFPWFNVHPTDDSLPSHGYARIRAWSLDSERYDSETETAEIVLSLEIAPFTLRYRLRLRETAVAEISVTNTSDEAQRAELVFHSYYQVSDVDSIALHGFGRAHYLDQLDDDRPKQLSADENPIQIDEEYDRIFPGAKQPKHLEDEGHGRVIEIEKSGLDASVVWNPWSEKAARLSDLGNDEWRGFVCVESGALGDDAICLEPGESKTVSLQISVAAFPK